MSDNFVRLNMKVKRYCKKTGRVTGSRYKRLQWKKLQEEREGPKVGGRRVNVCFKCGKPGHWARNCTDKGGYDNLGSFGGEKVVFCDEEIDEMEEENEDFDRLLAECPFPSVEETEVAEQGKETAASLGPGPFDQVPGDGVSLSLPDLSPSEPLLSKPTPVEPLLPQDKVLESMVHDSCNRYYKTVFKLRCSIVCHDSIEHSWIPGV